MHKSFENLITKIFALYFKIKLIKKHVKVEKSQRNHMQILIH